MTLEYMSWSSARGYETKNFSYGELKCSHCGVNLVQKFALKQLQKLRETLGKPIKVNCASRCKDHPLEVEKSTVGRHVEGIAFDISCKPREIAEIISIAYPLGFRGFGYADGYLHIDLRTKDAGWFY